MGPKEVRMIESIKMVHYISNLNEWNTFHQETFV